MFTPSMVNDVVVRGFGEVHVEFGIFKPTNKQLAMVRDHLIDAGFIKGTVADGVRDVSRKEGGEPSIWRSLFA